MHIYVVHSCFEGQIVKKKKVIYFAYFIMSPNGLMFYYQQTKINKL